MPFASYLSRPEYVTVQLLLPSGAVTVRSSASTVTDSLLAQPSVVRYSVSQPAKTSSAGRPFCAFPSSTHVLVTVTFTVPVSVLVMVPPLSTPVSSPIAAVSPRKLWTYSLPSVTVSTTA